MATAVLDLELQQLPSQITGLDNYDRALILIRFRGQPVGKALLPVVGGYIGGAELHTALMNAGGWLLWERWIYSYLGWDETRTSNSASRPTTIAICTRDRPEDLRRCLDAIMRLPDDGQDVLVVDNCPSTDATRLIAETYARVRYVREDRPGLNVARNRALREARHQIVAFADDDTVPDSGWLRALTANFDHPLTLCVTGLTMPLELETKAQEWFERHNPFGKGFARTVFKGNETSPLLVGRIGAGANMAVRSNLPELVGSFDEALDAGTPTYSGGDHEMFSRILISGYNIIYDPRALSWHRHRRTWEELRRVVYGYGVGVYALMTRRLLVDGELGAVNVLWGWPWHKQCRTLIRSLFRYPDTTPRDLLLAELRGCIAGPRAYFASRKQNRANEPHA